jgi:hypothetical protein
MWLFESCEVPALVFDVDPVGDRVVGLGVAADSDVVGENDRAVGTPEGCLGAPQPPVWA